MLVGRYRQYRRAKDPSQHAHAEEHEEFYRSEIAHLRASRVFFEYNIRGDARAFQECSRPPLRPVLTVALNRGSSYSIVNGCMQFVKASDAPRSVQPDRMTDRMPRNRTARLRKPQARHTSASKRSNN